MARTSIEWCDHSINPLRARLNGATGHHCVKVSPGCKNCYSSRLQSRFRMPAFREDQRRDIELFLHEPALREVLRRRKPTRYFWCDMTDLFGDWVPDETIDRCFAVMALTPQHTHLVLTKRPEQMREYLSTEDRVSVVEEQLFTLHSDDTTNAIPLDGWPLPNVWLGVSCENQQYADERIPLLLQTPAAVRWVSYEPALGPIQIARYLDGHEEHGTPLSGARTVGGCISWTPPLDWLVVGGESGPGARPFDLAWARSTIAQCKAAGVACFVKQLGRWPLTERLPSDITRNGFPLTDGPAIAGNRLLLHDLKGGDITEWPEDLRVRDYPST